MKILVSLALTFVSMLLFLPSVGTTEIRNLPLLLMILGVLLVFFSVGVVKQIVLMIKARKILREKGFRCIKFCANPFASVLRGRYRMTFQRNAERLNVVFLVKKKRYPHYYCKDMNHIEFYRSNRVVFQAARHKGATVSNLVETKLVGKQRIKWKHKAEGEKSMDILCFDKLPFLITDSVKNEGLNNGDLICASAVKLFDLAGLCEENDF